ncbi:MAG: hypothetical protein OXC28_16220 [Defluviicoccus sp.]|nr:hypothetical protein [Defluviicoccus sp.]
MFNHALNSPEGQREVLRRLLESAKQTEQKFQQLESYSKELEGLIAILIETYPEERKSEILERLAQIASPERDAKVRQSPFIRASDLRNLARRMLDRIRDS